MRVSKLVMMVVTLAATLPTTLPGQVAIPGAQAEMGANLPAQPIGPNDLLAISVYAAPELTRTVRVSAEGLIRLPMLHEKIEAQGLMPAELETRIAAVLSEEEILVEPVVTVAIAEYQSRPISVAGAVKTPLTFQAAGRTTLLEALTRAQGLTEEAGSEILVTRASKSGEPGLLSRIPVKGLIDAADPQWNITLEGGEEVRVPQAGRVFVVGNVKRPGAFRVDEAAGMTVLKAMAMAEGLTPYATKEAYIYRRGQGVGAEGPATELTVDLRKIMDRKAPDVAVGPNDILYIPDNRSARVTVSVIERAVGFAAATASGVLILNH
ncbi:MAG TPA: polysaccharide biosynthesis/export family protein [Bryobacteraceae bacterium]|nr:polysaccharide biosynthesis/export family protein [Bryobacteraceae bacterium]